MNLALTAEYNDPLLLLSPANATQPLDMVQLSTVIFGNISTFFVKDSVAISRGIALHT